LIDAAWHDARALVLRYGWNPAAYQILNPGMRRWFSRDRDAVAGFATYAGVRVVAGAPVCAAQRLEEVARELEDDAARCGERLLYFGAGGRLEQAYAARADRSMVLLGAQPAWDPRSWPDVVRGKASLRAQLNRARNKGVLVAEWPAERARDSAVLRRVLLDWLATRGLPPLGFMVTPDLLGLVDDRRVFVAERGDGQGVVGFLVASPIPARNGWLVEQWPRASGAPNGTTHLLVDAAMHAVRDAGSTFVSLGLAPLSNRGGEPAAAPPVWLRLTLRWLRAHGRRFYNFSGLEAFKASLQPREWEPVFAIAPARTFTPRMLRAVAGVFAGGSPELLLARAIRSAMAQEWRAIRARAGTGEARAH
jgi:phosphatidylglycerol lysyltransferase